MIRLSKADLGGSKPWLRISTASVAVVSAIALLVSCSGFFPGKDTVVSLSLSPTGAYVKPQATQQYSATATFGDNSTGDVTSSVTWTSSVPAIATIDTGGLATAVALGTTTITAKSSNNVTATSVLTVSNKTVTSLTINASTTSISLSANQTAVFTATVTFSDNTTANVTSQATWTSSVPTVATISANGVASPVSVGTTTIGASYGGQTASPISLTVTQ